MLEFLLLVIIALLGWIGVMVLVAGPEVEVKSSGFDKLDRVSSELITIRSRLGDLGSISESMLAGLRAIHRRNWIQADDGTYIDAGHVERLDFSNLGQPIVTLTSGETYLFDKEDAGTILDALRIYAP
jgi:hypothetical protein